MTLQITEDLGSFVSSRAGGASPDDAARELIVLELYREHRVSRGKAAELLNMPLEDFLEKAGRLGIPYLDMSDEDWAHEVESVNAFVQARGL